MAERFIREPERRHVTGTSRSTWWRLERKGLAPKRRQISPNAVAWVESEILEWIRSRAEKSAA